jgi:hypothetical protein
MEKYLRDKEKWRQAPQLDKNSNGCMEFKLEYETGWRDAMFTSADKTVVAGVMAILIIITVLWGDSWWSHVTEETIAIILAVLTPIFVWLFPNK